MVIRKFLANKFAPLDVCGALLQENIYSQETSPNEQETKKETLSRCK